MRRPIYLDHHATTPVDRRVAALMLHVMTEKFGNPNDRGHLYGEEARRIDEENRLSLTTSGSRIPTEPLPEPSRSMQRRRIPYRRFRT